MQWKSGERVAHDKSTSSFTETLYSSQLEIFSSMICGMKPCQWQLLMRDIKAVNESFLAANVPAAAIEIEPKKEQFLKAAQLDQDLELDDFDSSLSN